VTKEDRGAREELRRRRVLVVDDNTDAANSLARLLTRLYGQDVRVSNDGPSALEAAEEFRPEMVLLDIGMPEMDGYEVARRLRSRPGFEQPLLVALTGWGQQSDRRRSAEAGFDRHLVKPVDPELLEDLLAGVAEPGPPPPRPGGGG
jgi:CheY-like chemotaxis protein